MAITASEARRALFPLIEKVNDDRAPIEITSRRGNAVLMSADEYAGVAGDGLPVPLSPANARRLLDAAEAAHRGEVVDHPARPGVRLVFTPQGWEDYTLLAAG